VLTSSLDYINVVWGDDIVFLPDSVLKLREHIVIVLYWRAFTFTFISLTPEAHRDVVMGFFLAPGVAVVSCDSEDAFDFC